MWRRLQVPSTCTLGELSALLIASFEWAGDHLHGFEVRGAQYGPEQLQDPFSFASFRRPSVLDEDAASLERVAPRPGAVLDYTYDFGDDWRHRIEVEDVLPADPDQLYPRCVDGRGLAPEEDTGEVRPGRFDQVDVAAINLVFRKFHGAVAGRTLADAPDDGSEPDPVFAGLFPQLAPSPPDGERCECGEAHGVDDATIPLLYRPVPDDDLAELAGASPLVRRAVALARWVGEDRALTPSHLLRPADAQQAFAELGLAEPVLPPTEGASPTAFTSWSQRRKQQQADRAAASGAAPRLRSAKDLPELHALWSAAVGAGLIDIRGTRAGIGQSARLWDGAGAGSAHDRLDSWARLLAGFLQARMDADFDDRGYRPVRKDELLTACIPLLYMVAREPIPAALLVLLLAAAEPDQMFGSFGLNAFLLPAMEAASEDWALAGVIAAVEADPAVQAGNGALVTSALGSFLGSTDAPFEDDDLDPVDDLTAGPEHLIELLRPIEEAVRASVTIALTPLGMYGLRRILTAHGWQLPVVGDCAQLAPEDLLDRLITFLPEDATTEAEVWLTARGAGWERALGEVAESARTADRSVGPVRRVALHCVLQAAGPRALPLLTSFGGDRWLSAVGSAARHALGLGPEPTQAEALWLAIDQLSEHLGGPADDVADEAADSTLSELLAEDGAIATALTVDHPDARQTLLVVAMAMEDRRLGSELHRALDSRSARRTTRSGSRRQRR